MLHYIHILVNLKNQLITPFLSLQYNYLLLCSYYCVIDIERRGNTLVVVVVVEVADIENYSLTVETNIIIKPQNIGME